MAQNFTDQVFYRPALSFANQAWLPYQDDFFKTVDKPVVFFAFSMFYQNEVNQYFKVRTGLGVKQKGTHKENYPYPTPGTDFTTYKHFALTGSSEVLYFVTGYAANKFYLVGGLGFDYMIEEKPVIQNWSPVVVETHFEQNDYNRMILNAPLGLGVTLSEIVSLEFVYSLALTPGLNVRQLLIRDRYCSLGLYVRLGYPPSAKIPSEARITID